MLIIRLRLSPAAQNFVTISNLPTPVLNQHIFKRLILYQSADA